MTKVKEFINHAGYCKHTPFWSDSAVAGFFLMGISLGIVLGMSLLHVCK